MIRNNLLAKIAGGGYFYRWHPEVAIRYLPIVREIKKYGKGKSVLEIGSGGLGIAPYLHQKITGVDVNFHPPFYHLLEQVKGSALALPFRESQFDIVLSTDMLEHLNKIKRDRAIKEMFRVAKEKIIIGIPCGQKAYEQDKLLDNYFFFKFHKRYHFLEEQLSLGLPKEKEILKSIKHAAKAKRKKIQINIIGNENLSLRFFLMRGWITDNFLKNLFYRKVLLFFLPFFNFFNHPPFYRKIFVINII